MSFETTIDLGDIGEQNVEVEFDYQPAERMTRDDPGCHEEVTITSVLWRGLQIVDDLTEGAIDVLEEQAFESKEGDYIQAAEDRAEYLRDLRDAA